eukprot:TRINITY_DN19160_c0_g1_i1.p1 TRINITY_DN19160_c0_g1~~TRINITY_DN19160_c0_g1_i1.p1  ORF type:complete len:316 (-),score=50.74 TRINITY_DN19160_c0_g1_i1:19-966(-)
MRKTRGPSAPPPRTTDILRRFPANPQEALTDSELERLRRIASSCDMDGDSLVSKRELIMCMQRDEGVADFFGLSSKLSVADGSAQRMEELFTALDSDKSDALDFNELCKFFLLCAETGRIVRYDDDVDKSTLAGQGSAGPQNVHPAESWAKPKSKFGGAGPSKGLLCTLTPLDYEMRHQHRRPFRGMAGRLPASLDVDHDIPFSRGGNGAGRPLTPGSRGVDSGAGRVAPNPPVAIAATGRLPSSQASGGFVGGTPRVGSGGGIGNMEAFQRRLAELSPRLGADAANRIGRSGAFGSAGSAGGFGGCSGFGGYGG